LTLHQLVGEWLNDQAKAKVARAKEGTLFGDVNALHDYSVLARLLPNAPPIKHFSSECGGMALHLWSGILAARKLLAEDKVLVRSPYLKDLPSFLMRTKSFGSKDREILNGILKANSPTNSKLALEIERFVFRAHGIEWTGGRTSRDVLSQLRFQERLSAERTKGTADPYAHLLFADVGFSDWHFTSE
jgi:hypothetical protein